MFIVMTVHDRQGLHVYCEDTSTRQGDYMFIARTVHDRQGLHVYCEDSTRQTGITCLL